MTRLQNFKYWTPEFSRLYLGQEFCERLLPEVETLSSALKFVREKNLDFTLVTPPVTEKGLKKLIKLLEFLRQEGGKRYEIIINDWGVFSYLKEENYQNPLVLGRLLVKQKRGPRIMNLKGKIPETAMDHFKRAAVDSPLMTRFLRENGIRRIELDNLLFGMKREADSLPASLYYPYAYITLTRLCLFAHFGKRHLRGIVPCQKECEKFQVKLTHPSMPVPLIMAGNAQFYEKKELPPDLSGLGIDRLVYEPEVPV